jgi:hypothetical protein
VLSVFQLDAVACDVPGALPPGQRGGQRGYPVGGTQGSCIRRSEGVCAAHPSRQQAQSPSAASTHAEEGAPLPTCTPVPTHLCHYLCVPHLPRPSALLALCLCAPTTHTYVCVPSTPVPQCITALGCVSLKAFTPLPSSSRKAHRAQALRLTPHRIRCSALTWSGVSSAGHGGRVRMGLHDDGERGVWPRSGCASWAVRGWSLDRLAS